jgi:hypothetical protein
MVITVLGSATLHAATITFSDSTFADADWTATGIGPGLLGFTAGQVPTGGNPGTFRQNTLTFNIGSVYVANLSPAFVYTASTLPIISLSGSYDVIRTGPYAVGIALALLQNGSYYISSGGTSAYNPAWTPGQVFLTSPTSFSRMSGSGPLIPDFSATGAPLELGYASINFDTAPGTILTSQSGIDNLSITVISGTIGGIPEPTSVSLFTAGMALMAALKRASGPSRRK